MKIHMFRLLFTVLAVIGLMACSLTLNLPGVDLDSAGRTATAVLGNVRKTLAVTVDLPDLPGLTLPPVELPGVTLPTLDLPDLQITLDAGGGQATPLPGDPSGSVQLYFSRPEGQADENGVLEEALLSDLNAAETGIDMAMYNFSLRRVANALMEAQQRGVHVRVVIDNDALDNTQVERLQMAGVEIRGDTDNGLMHNKFLVIDRELVWTGSLNLTGSGTYQDDNNFARIQSTQLAQNYTAEFEEMFLGSLFGANSPSHTPHRQLEIGGAPALNFFAPEDGVSPILVDLIDASKTSVDVLAYSFTSDPLAQAVEERHAAGVPVRIVFDESQARSNTGGEYLRLRRAGLDARLDGNEGLMHHKVIILDRATVVFGSYNFTGNADRQNDENLLIVQSPALAERFLAEFERIYARASLE